MSLRAYAFGPFRLDLVRQQLRQGEGYRPLTPKGFDLLQYLVERPGQLLTKQELLDGLWPDVAVGDAVLKVRVGEVRKALGETASRPRYIETAHRRGYRFIAKVQEEGPPPEGELREALAVLPFESASEDPEQDYLAAGLAEELCSRLSAQGRLPVIAWSSTSTLRSEELEPLRCGRRLGARHLLRGTVRRAGERVRIRAELVDAANGERRWGDRYDRPLADVLRLEDEIADRVAEAVGSELFRERKRDHATLDAVHLEAYDTLLRGAFYQRSHTRESAEMARACYERALEGDPELVAAHFGMAISHAFDLLNLWSDDPLQSAARLFQHAHRCVAIDEENTLGHAILGFGNVVTGQQDVAERSLRRAIELDRNRPGPHAARGFLRVLAGRYEEGLAHLEEAVSLSPLDPELWLFRFGQALAEALARRPKAGLARATESLALRPLWHARVLSAVCRAMLGEADAARAEVEAIERERPGFAIGTVEGFLGAAEPEVRERFVALLAEAGFREE